MSDELRRKNSVGVVEVAHLRGDPELYHKEHTRIFGEPPKKFCDVCDKRLSFCECEKEDAPKTDTQE